MLTGLQRAASYRVRLLAENDEGRSSWSAVAAATTAAKAPGAPAPPVLAAATRTSVALAWRAPEDNGGATVLKYQVSGQRQLCSA